MQNLPWLSAHQNILLKFRLHWVCFQFSFFYPFIAALNQCCLHLWEPERVRQRVTSIHKACETIKASILRAWRLYWAVCCSAYDWFDWLKSPELTVSLHLVKGMINASSRNWINDAHRGLWLCKEVGEWKGGLGNSAGEKSPGFWSSVSFLGQLKPADLKSFICRGLAKHAQLCWGRWEYRFTAGLPFLGFVSTQESEFI